MNIDLNKDELAAVMSALVDREDLLVCGNSADEEHHGEAWTTQQIAIVRALILRLS